VVSPDFGSADYETYVTAWRMTVASRLLREGRQPLREIAHRVGYDSEFAFARAFTRTVGHAPGRYRAAAGQPDRHAPPVTERWSSRTSDGRRARR
jgi:AraC-like DNA-binding protein